MRTVISHEFGTPILLDNWGDHERHKIEIIETITKQLSNQSPVAEKRGQENDQLYGFSSPSAETHIYKIKTIYRSKQETNDDLHLSQSSSIRALLLWILEQAKKLIDSVGGGPTMEFLPRVLNCWASVYQNGDNHDVHIHPASLLSCVYCVSTNQNGGTLVLHDPRPNINYSHFECGLWSSNARMIDLQPGQLIIFPGWLPHSVTPTRGEGNRITISANLDASRFPLSQDSIRAR